MQKYAQEITHHMEHFFGGGGQGKENERIGNIFIRKLINSQSPRVSSSHPAKQWKINIYIYIYITWWIIYWIMAKYFT